MKARKVEALRERITIVKNELATLQAELKVAERSREQKRLYRQKRKPEIIDSRYQLLKVVYISSFQTTYYIAGVLYGEDSASIKAGNTKHRLMALRDLGLVNRIESKNSKGHMCYRWVMTAKGVQTFRNEHNRRYPKGV